MDNKNPRPPCFLLVLDTATMSAEELQDAKDSVGQLVALLPEECLVGLITFGATVTVHELCDGPMPKSYVLRGTDDVTQEQLKKSRSGALAPRARGVQQAARIRRGGGEQRAATVHPPRVRVRVHPPDNPR